MTVDELIEQLQNLPESMKGAPVWARDVTGHLVPIAPGGIGLWNPDTGVVVGIEGIKS